MKGFCYQENTHFSQAVSCSREEFWESVRNTSNQWKIDSRRDILAAVENQDEAAIAKWLKNEDYQKFLAKKRSLKKLSARQKFNTIATAVGEDPGTIEEVCEPFLIQEGFIMRTPRGRECTDLAYKHLGKTRFAPTGEMNLFSNE